MYGKVKRNWFILFVSIMACICLLCIPECVPRTIYASESTIYISSTGVDSNPGTSDAPVLTMEKALELVAEDGIICITDSARTEQLSGDEPLCISKNITITGGSLTLNRAGIVLGADVTFQDTKLNFSNAVYNAIVANGHSLTLENVTSIGTWPVHLFCGAMTGYTGSLPASGTEGVIIFVGTNELV